MITGAHVVLQGSGSGGPDVTELFFKETLVPDNPADSTDYSQKVAPFIYFKSTVGGVGNLRTTIAADAIRGAFTVIATDVSKLTVGMFVYLQSQNPAAKYFLQGLQPQSHWTNIIDNGVKVQEKHFIVDITGNILTLAEPLLCNITASHGWDIRKDGLTEGWGVQA